MGHVVDRQHETYAALKRELRVLLLTSKYFCVIILSMLVMRLQRIGRKHQPSYRLVVAERRSKLGAPPREDLGAYDPFSKSNTFNAERVKYWFGKGAMPSATVHNMLIKIGVTRGKKIPLGQKKSKKTESVAPEVAAKTIVEEPPATI